MLLDSQLVPETIVRPRSFVGLMLLYESNFIRLQNLIPDLERLDGYYVSRVAGDCDLHLEILNRSRYTVTLSLSYFFEENGCRIADPDMQIRANLEGRHAEVVSQRHDQRHAELRRLSQAQRAELDARWRRNIVLNKWLEYLMDQGHLLLDR